MRSFEIAIFLIIFGAVCGIFNASGIFDVHLAAGMPDGYSEETIMPFVENAADAAANPFGTFAGILPLISAVLIGVVQALTITPLLMSFGVPVWIAIPISLPIWFIYGIDILNWVLNRQ